MRISKLSFIVAVLAALLLIVVKVRAGMEYGFILGLHEPILPNGFLLFWPDEITYITWLDTRYDAFQAILSGERDATNLFGYYVGYFYALMDDWRYMYLIGLIGLIVFYVSALKLFKIIDTDNRRSDLLLSIFLLSPTVIVLASSALRELYILAIVNLIIIYCCQRRLIPIIIALISLFFLRNFYIVILAPVFVYFWFYYNRRRYRISLLVGVMALVVLLIVVWLKSSIYLTSDMDIVFRMITAFTGFNIEILSLDKLFSENIAFTLERLGLIYQFMFMCCLYCYLIIRGLRINLFLLVCFIVMLNLAITYGYFLGYFVTRTKLILIWLVVLYLVSEAKDKSRVELC